MDHFFFVHVSIGGNFDFFQDLAMVNVAGVQDCQPVTFWITSSQVIGPAVHMLYGMVAKWSPFQGTSIVFSLVALTTSHLEPRVRISPQTLQHL